MSHFALCYQLIFYNISWTDNRPDFIVNMTFDDPGSIRSETTVNREIAYPVSKFRIVVREDKRSSTLYNVTARMCDLVSTFSKVPLVKQGYITAVKQSNMSFDCPLKPGFYVMGNIRIGSRNPVVSFLYRPKVVYLITGGMYEELKNKSLIPLTTYKISVKIVKKPCKE
uniref:MD-2-related lipid-recognition domain-containing protein n=1 Tax=Musca domestica TaxID=7370 RepID=A0A1I8MNM7_MUSDO